MLPKKLLKPYDPQETEDRIYPLWEESGFFNPDNLPERHREPYTIIMPPPNSNDSLHAGHAMFLTIEDLIIRYKRMVGFKTLWLPGADHAGFETQVVYEKKLEKEGRSRFKMDRKEFYDEVMKFTLDNKKYMERQIRKLGSSCDWSRNTFTLDDKIIKVVYDTFKKLDEDKLLYRGKRIINWCVKHQTSLSQLETKNVDRKDPLYYIKYGPFVLATVRPETKFGDTAIAVHPKDDRYKKYVGKEVEIDTLIGKKKIKVIADEYVDPEFGTGVVKITPAHDPNDFEVGKRHKLPVIEVIDQYGRLNELCGKYAGLKINEARKVIVEDLKKAGLLEKIDEDYDHTVVTCYKCDKILEPRIMPQWFIKMEPFAKKAIQAVDTKKTTFVTEKFEKIFRHWMETIEDWNISRQIAWGISIPAKLCTQCDEGMVDIEDTITSCTKCGGDVIADPDTFDTWFSSGQWPYATLNYPDGDDFKNYYPTSVIETGADIIFFWVARMLMLGLYRTGKVPFESVYLHGLVRDKHGKKMSKSKGNVISPIEITDKFGTDALRMALIIGNTPGTDLALSLDKIKGYKHFANKIWNITRFILTNTEDFDKNATVKYSKDDKKILNDLTTVVKETTDALEKSRFHIAADTVYHYLWHELADKIIESSKELLQGEASPERTSRQKVLLETLTTTLKLLHPFMPFITEEVWSMLPDTTHLLMMEKWPN